jgi:hypothetical protein
VKFLHPNAIALVACAVSTVCSAAQTIPVERTFPQAWQNAGYPAGAVPLPAKIVNVREFGVKGDGATDDAKAVAAAIASLNGAAGVIFFPSGNYLLKSTVNLPAGVVLRGESSEKTTLYFETTGHCIVVARGQNAPFQPVASGYTIHSSKITVTNGGSFAAGDWAEIRQDNDPAWGASAWAQKTVGQILRVTAVDGNALTLERPLRITYRAELKPEIRKITPITECGIENLKLDRKKVGTDKQRDNIDTIHFNYAARCWVRGVESANGFGAHIGISAGTQISITGCYIHHAADYDGGGSGYGVKLQLKTGECLIENNIFQSLRHSMLVQAGANGNVFGYNYSREPTRTEFPAEVSGDVVCHGNYVYANLFEGNICQHIWVDSSHGANGPLNTFFRNRAESYGFTITDARVERQNIVGNETFRGAFSAFLGGGYGLAGKDHFEHANNTADGLRPPNTNSLKDISYYLAKDPHQPVKPKFWDIKDEFPSIGVPRDWKPEKNNPARARFLSGKNFTVGK